MKFNKKEMKINLKKMNKIENYCGKINAA